MIPDRVTGYFSVVGTMRHLGGPCCLRYVDPLFGRNSLAPIAMAISMIRDRVGPERTISVAHTDLPSNDFYALFKTLADDPNSYLPGDPAQVRAYPSTEIRAPPVLEGRISSFRLCL